jgi:hypothetical protein
LAENNNKEWFDLNRADYQAKALAPVKTFVAEIGPILKMLNEEFEVEPRVGRTISRINNDLRFHRNRPAYRPFIYAGFARRGRKWSTESLLYVGLFSHGASIGFYPGRYKPLGIGPVQEGIRKNTKLFQRYLDERHIAETYWEISGEENGAVAKWPLPKTARRWMNLESFTVGEHFASTEPILARRAFLDCAQKVLLDLYRARSQKQKAKGGRQKAVINCKATNFGCRMFIAVINSKWRKL